MSISSPAAGLYNECSVSVSLDSTRRRVAEKGPQRPIEVQRGGTGGCSAVVGGGRGLVRSVSGEQPLIRDVLVGVAEWLWSRVVAYHSGCSVTIEALGGIRVARPEPRGW